MILKNLKYSFSFFQNLTEALGWAIETLTKKGKGLGEGPQDSL